MQRKAHLSCTAQLPIEEVLERLSIVHGVTVLVVIEVSVNVRKVGCPAFDPIRPISQQRVAIVPLVFSRCAMEPDIREICRYFHRRLRSAPIVNAESNLMPAEQVENGGGVPAFIAKLEHVLVSSGQCRKKIRQPLGIYMPPGRKLKEDRS